MTRIFVYGTLRKGMYNYDIYLKNKKSLKQYGYVQGTLYTVKGADYPALLLEGNDMIIGEIHEVNDKTLKLINELECYYGENCIENEYDQMICPIYDRHNHFLENLPVYVFNMRNPENQKILGERIECLDYVRYINEKTTL